MSKSTQRLVRRMAAAVLLWLLVPAGAQVGVFIHEALYPGAGRNDPNSAPASLMFGAIGLVVGVAAAVGLTVWFKLGIIWLGVALLAAALLSLLGPVVHPIMLVVLLLLAPPILGALAQWWFDEARKN